MTTKVVSIGRNVKFQDFVRFHHFCGNQPITTIKIFFWLLIYTLW